MVPEHLAATVNSEQLGSWGFWDIWIMPDDFCQAISFCLI